MIEPMKRGLRAAICASVFAFGVVTLEMPSIAQEKPSASRSDEDGTGHSELIATLEYGFRASRFAEIYADLRYAVRELYLPAVKEALRTGDKAKFDVETRQALTLLVPVLEYSLKAAEELEPVLEANRDAMIRDVAELLSKHMSEDQIHLLGEMLQTPAMRKGFNAFYAFTRLITGYTREDVETSREMAEWMRDLKFDLKNNLFTERDVPPPPRERFEKAEGIVSDFMRVSRIDDMVAEIVRFNKEVLLQLETLEDDKREKIRAGVEQFDFSYNLGKSMTMAVAPSALASAFDDEQLGKLHLIVLSPVIAKSFGLLYDFVREATSFTKFDLAEFYALTQEAEKLDSKHDPEEQQALEADWQKLAEKWREIFQNALTPETRAGLERSIAEFRAFAEERERRRRDGIEQQYPAPGEREL
jgi:hypothetical protein